jgi:glycosyltransferase involved in cell wall biosynthesis
MTGALLIPNMEGGGAERTTLILAGELQARGQSVELVVCRARGPLAAEVPTGVPVVDLGVERLRTGLPALVRYLRSSRPDYLMPTIEHANVLSLLARSLSRTKTPVIVRVANSPSELAAAAVTPMERLTLLLARRLYRRADVLVACSFGMADDLATFLGVDPLTIRTLPNPTATKEIMHSAAAPLTHPWFSASEPPVILAVGSLRTKKNLPLLLEAFARVRCHREVRLLILGDGPERLRLERKVDEFGLGQNVALPGFDPNPFRYMSRCAVFALASDREGLPGVLIEALVCGANIVSTDCPSGPREILDGGRYGRLVPTGDVGAMAEGLTTALDDPITPSRQSWAPYTSERAADAYAELIEGLSR